MSFIPCLFSFHSLLLLRSSLLFLLHFFHLSLSLTLTFSGPSQVTSLIHKLTLRKTVHSLSTSHFPLPLLLFIYPFPYTSSVTLSCPIFFYIFYRASILSASSSFPSPYLPHFFLHFHSLTYLPIYLLPCPPPNLCCCCFHPSTFPLLLPSLSLCISSTTTTLVTSPSLSVAPESHNAPLTNYHSRGKGGTRSNSLQPLT